MHSLYVCMHCTHVQAAWPKKANEVFLHIKATADVSVSSVQQLWSSDKEDQEKNTNIFIYFSVSVFLVIASTLFSQSQHLRKKNKLILVKKGI